MTTRFDTVVTGGTLVIPYVGERRGDLGIRDGRIVTIADDLTRADSDLRVDASNKVVLPGAVDSHYHLGIYRDLAVDTESETTSSLVGGVTSVISYFRTGQHYLNKTGPYREILPEVLAAVDGHAKVDYGFHLAPMTAEHIGEIGWLVEQGITSFKYYMFYKGFNLAASSRDSASYTMSEDYDLGHLFEIMEKVADVQAAHPDKRISVSLHCEQAELMRVFIERAKRDPKLRGLAEYSAGRPPLTERLSIEEAGVLADATKVNLNFLHLSSQVALQTALEVSRRYPYLDVNRETTLHHLALDHETLDARGGLGRQGQPADQDQDRQRSALGGAAAWRGQHRGLRPRVLHGVAEGRRAVAGTARVRRHRPALPGVDLRGAPQARHLARPDRAGRRAKPAQTFGLYGRKGTIAVGADADLAVVDPELTQTVTAELCQSAQDHCPFEGVSVQGWPTTTIVRGMPMWDGGKMAPEFPGQFVKRG